MYVITPNPDAMSGNAFRLSDQEGTIVAMGNLLALGSNAAPNGVDFEFPVKFVGRMIQPTVPPGSVAA